MFSSNLKISKEEKFLINILFKEKKIVEEEIDFDKINYELLVKITSEHLMLPSLYINLTKKGFINLIPLELKTYLEEIYTLNKKRNQAALNEVNEISKKLIYSNINHVFLKGSSHLYNDIYINIGERMIGDIDILVSWEDLTKTISLFKKLNYKETKYAFFDNSRHHPRLINPKKIFALEVHYKLLPTKYKQKLNPELVLKNRIQINNKVYIPTNKHEILYSIYNYQINDNGNTKLSYSYRSFYDTSMLIKHSKFNMSNIKLDSYINNYLMIAKELRIPNIPISKIQVKKLNLYIFKLKYISKFFFYIYNFISVTIEKRKLRLKQIIKLIVNKKYREYVIKKTSNKL